MAQAREHDGFWGWSQVVLKTMYFLKPRSGNTFGRPPKRSPVDEVGALEALLPGNFVFSKIEMGKRGLGTFVQLNGFRVPIILKTNVSPRALNI